MSDEAKRKENRGKSGGEFWPSKARGPRPKGSGKNSDRRLAEQRERGVKRDRGERIGLLGVDWYFLGWCMFGK